MVRRNETPDDEFYRAVLIDAAKRAVCDVPSLDEKTCR